MRKVYLFDYALIFLSSVIVALPIIILGIPSLLSLFYLLRLRRKGLIGYYDLRDNIVKHTTLYGLSPVIMLGVIGILGIFGVNYVKPEAGMVILFVPYTAVVGFVVQLILGWYSRKFLLDL